MRKPHVKVDQDEILKLIIDTDRWWTAYQIANHFNISPTTARRKLDGLVYQGKIHMTTSTLYPYQYASPSRALYSD